MIAQPSRRLPALLCSFILIFLIASPFARDCALGFIRFPFTLLRWTLRTALLIPNLPALAGSQRELNERLTRSQIEIADLREALRHAEEEKILRGTLPSRQGVIAPVLGRSLIPTQHSLLLGKGRDSGILPDSAVLTGEGMVGRVVETHSGTSLVMLLTDPESRVAGLIERSRETGLLVGSGRGMLELIDLDAEADIKEGDVVVTAGVGRSYPKGIPLGTVSRIERRAASATATALVRPAGRLGFLEDVLCLPPGAQSPEAP